MHNDGGNTCVEDDTPNTHTKARLTDFTPPLLRDDLQSRLSLSSSLGFTSHLSSPPQPRLSPIISPVTSLSQSSHWSPPTSELLVRRSGTVHFACPGRDSHPYTGTGFRTLAAFDVEQLCQTLYLFPRTRRKVSTEYQRVRLNTHRDRRARHDNVKS